MVTARARGGEHLPPSLAGKSRMHEHASAGATRTSGEPMGAVTF